jgi:hypothetical protein
MADSVMTAMNRACRLEDGGQLSCASCRRAGDARVMQVPDRRRFDRLVLVTVSTYRRQTLYLAVSMLLHFSHMMSLDAVGVGEECRSAQRM